ncbi:MAG: hypothetical protein J6N76_03820 [Lachnospiraceae bacterium]|nr:hypothetical protein [Lachnospiraceae bacterium]
MGDFAQQDIQKKIEELKQTQLQETEESYQYPQALGFSEEGTNEIPGAVPFEPAPKEARKKSVSGAVNSLFHRKRSAGVGDDNAADASAGEKVLRESDFKLDLEYAYTEQYEKVHKQELEMYNYLEEDTKEDSQAFKEVSDVAKKYLLDLKEKIAFQSGKIKSVKRSRAPEVDAAVSFFTEYENELRKVNEEKEGTTLHSRYRAFMDMANKKWGLKDQDHKYLELYARQYKETQGDLSLDEIKKAKSGSVLDYTKKDKNFKYDVVVPLKEPFEKDGKTYTKGVYIMEKVNLPLFSKEPTPKDVIQGGGFGDCYFMASLTAVVEKDPKYIKNMMRDNGNSVTVRFYKPNGKPLYVTVQKTYLAGALTNQQGDILVTDRIGPVSEGAALWVSMIEKAYAAARSQLETNGDFLYEARENVRQSDTQYGMLRMGSTRGMLRTFLGKDHKLKESIDLEEKFQSKISTSIRGSKLISSMESDSKAAYAKELKGQGKKLDKVQWNIKKAEMFFGVKIQDSNDALYKFFSDDKIFKTMQTHIQKVLNDEFTTDKLSTVTDGLELNRFLREQIDKMPKLDIPGYDENQMKEHYLNYMKSYVQNTKKLTLTVNKDGNYTKSENKIFDKMKKASESGKFMTIELKELKFSLADKVGRSGGETVLFGMAGSHAYSIRDVSEEERIVGGKKVKQKFVTVVNPWKDIIRQYDKDGNPYTVKNDNKTGLDTGGAFKMELRDFLTTTKFLNVA